MVGESGADSRPRARQPGRQVHDHVLARRAVPASEAVETLLTFLRPTLESYGEWDEISSLAREVVARGNGADRQRAAFARGGRFEDVMDLILEETARGT